MKTESAIAVQHRYLLEELYAPVDGYRYLVRTETSVDGGNTFWYCGNSRYFKTEKEAISYKAEKEKENNNI